MPGGAKARSGSLGRGCMNIIEQIINLNTVAIMGGTVLDRFYVGREELRQIFKANLPRPSLGDMESIGGFGPGIKGYIDGVAIIVVDKQ